MNSVTKVMTENIRRTERGWPGHFILADRCKFRRNTLLECGYTKIVVSTVGNPIEEGVFLFDYDYETMAFHAELRDGYLEANPSRQVNLSSPCRMKWINIQSDAKANLMHEQAVDEISAKLLEGRA